MSSLIIKITQNGSSREYLFNKSGPLVIGSDERCDLWLNDPELEAKMLEVKVSGGNIFIKELGARSEIYLGSVILPFREETPYHEGETILLKNTSYQIHIQLTTPAVAEPPPFFEDEFKARLEKITHDLKDREQELKRLNTLEEKKQGRINELEAQWHSHLHEKSMLKIEVDALKSHKEHLNASIKQNEKNRSDHSEHDQLLKNHIEKLEQEERSLKESVLATNQALSRLKDERETKNKEMSQQRIVLSNLEMEAVKLKSLMGNLDLERSEGEQEVQNESLKLQKILKDSETANRERIKAEHSYQKMLNQKSTLDYDVENLKELIGSLSATQTVAETKIHELKSSLLTDEAHYLEIQEKIGRYTEEQNQLSSLITDLHAEIDKAENKLKFKKDQLNQFDFQCQDSMQKLTTANFELERVSHYLKERVGEEESHNVKILALREEIKVLTKKAYEEKKELNRGFAQERHKLDLDLKAFEHDIESRKVELMGLESDYKSFLIRNAEAESGYQVLQAQKKVLESEVVKLDSERGLIQQELNQLKNETLRLQHEKGRIEKDLSSLRIKLLDSENQIKQREEEARLSLEDFKREERAKMLVEKEVLLSEVEAFKQKTLIEVDMTFRQQQNDLFGLKLAAQHESNDILSAARKLEEEMTSEARNRLQAATTEAHQREIQSHDRIQEAQEYFKQKEAEADNIIQRSRLEARDVIKKSEVELMEQLKSRKQKIKRFLTMKQEQGLIHLKNLQDQHLSRMKKNEVKGHEQIEHLKRKELKKIAHMHEEEMGRQHDHRAIAMKEVNAEKERVRRQVLSMKAQQENELESTKRSVLENINQIKFRQQNALEEELKQARQSFEQSKSARIENATQAVMNVMIGEFGFNSESQDKVKERLQSTLKMAIDGQNADGLKHIGQILDFNPMLRKTMMPVLKKYALSFGLPAVIGLVLMADIGSMRTKLVDFSKNLILQKQSSSDMYVEQQKVAWKEKYTFNPPTTVEYKASFTDNVLYTTNFEQIMDNEQYQNAWILKVHEYMVKELELSEDVAINYISSEGTLIKDLFNLKKEITPQYKDVGIAKLVAAETAQLGWLLEKLATPVKIQKFSDFRKSFYHEFINQKPRDLASDPN